jgi:hypothetical protein
VGFCCHPRPPLPWGEALSPRRSVRQSGRPLERKPLGFAPPYEGSAHLAAHTHTHPRKHIAIPATEASYAKSQRHAIPLRKNRGNNSTEGWCLCAGFRGTHGVAEKKTNRPPHDNARRGGGRSAGGLLATECERVEQVHKLKAASPTVRVIESCGQPSSLASLLPSEPKSILALASSPSIRRLTG